MAAGEAGDGAWQEWVDKEWVFTRGLSRGYALKEEMRRLQALPRVIKQADRKWEGGPQHWNQYTMHPSFGGMQSIESHIEDMCPGARSQNHGHMNEAVFYILEGRGHEVHDGQRYDWEAGDVVIVHNNCVHQHFNDDPERPARAIVIKAKPVHIFLNLLFQGDIERIPREPVPGFENYHPERREAEQGAGR